MRSLSFWVGLAFVALTFNLGAYSFAQTPPRAPAPTSTASTPKALPAESAEVQVLRAQNAEIRSFNDRILGTVWWGLGVLGGVAVLLVGYSWFSSQRSLENDRTALRQELLADVQKIESELSKKIAATSEMASKSLDGQIAKMLEPIRSSLKGEISGLDQRLIELELGVIRAEFAEHKQKGYLGTAMRSATRFLELALREQYEIYVDEGFAMMADIVSIIEAVPKGQYNSKTDPGSVEDAIKIVGKSTKHQTVGAKLRERLAALPL